ncbi:hypothetical protein ACIA5G_52210 [Amycolatopsis sp. NPDC051758]|uniref:hypothetical protein n=1 Tax=Amycolatopsis sp. NPDC051758 TaxID=3363935 RepID=UPI0037AE691F
MQNRKKRLLWAVLAVLLPGPWTPVIVLACLLGHAAERDQDTAHYAWDPPYRPPDPYACVPAPARLNFHTNPYAPPR